MTTTPRGIVAVLIAPDGHVVAHAADFGRSGAAGFNQHDQRIRAKRMLAVNAVKETCATYIGETIDLYLEEQIVRHLVDRHNFRIETIAIGYEDE